MPEEGILTGTYFARDQVPDCPDFTRAKNKLPSWDEYFMPRHSSVFANDLGDRGSIPGRVIPKTQKIVLDATLLCTQHYKARIKLSNLENGVAHFLHLGVVAIEKVTNFTFFHDY